MQPNHGITCRAALRSSFRRRELMCVSVMMLCTVPMAAASNSYHFEAAGTVLATIELANLPATHGEILSLTFTPDGDEFYGLGEAYLGNFDTASHPIDELVSGRLGCPTSLPSAVATFEDLNPPPSGGLSLTKVQQGFGNDPASSFLFRIAPPAFFGDPMGDWIVAVPEPTSVMLL